MLTLYDDKKPYELLDAMAIIQLLLGQAHPPKGWDDERHDWSISKFEINIDKCVAHLNHYDWDTGKTTHHKATFGAEMMHFEDVEDTNVHSTKPE
jgi:hypothetical protein